MSTRHPAQFLDNKSIPAPGVKPGTEMLFAYLPAVLDNQGDRGG